MEIHAFKREKKHYVAYVNGKVIAKFEYAVPIVILSVGKVGGVLFEDGKPTCWSTDWQIPGPPLSGEVKSKTCVKVDDMRKPVLDAGLIQSECEFRRGKCMPSITIVFAVYDEDFNRKAGGLKTYSFTFIGSEVGGKANHDEMLFSPRSIHSILKLTNGNECAKHKVFLKWSDKEKRSYIHIPDDTSIGPTPEAEQANYEALTKIWAKHEADNTDAIKTSVDPRLWSTKYNFKAIEGERKKNKDKYENRKRKAKGLKPKSKDPRVGRLAYLKRTLPRGDLKPATRKRLQAEYDKLIETNPNA